MFRKRNILNSLFVEKWRSYLMHQNFNLLDHKNLEKLFNEVKNFKQGKLYRWCVRLQDFHFIVKS